jgi:hypothetical protein
VVGILFETRSAYSLRASGFTTGVFVCSVFLLILFSCIMFSFLFHSSLSCVLFHVCQMLYVSLDGPLLIVPSVYSNI